MAEKNLTSWEIKTFKRGDFVLADLQLMPFPRRRRCCEDIIREEKGFLTEPQITGLGRAVSYSQCKGMFICHISAYLFQGSIDSHFLTGFPKMIQIPRGNTSSPRHSLSRQRTQKQAYFGFKVCPGRPVIMPRRLCRAGGAVVNHLKLVKDVGRLGVFMFVLKYHLDPIEDQRQLLRLQGMNQQSF